MTAARTTALTQTAILPPAWGKSVPSVTVAVTELRADDDRGSARGEPAEFQLLDKRLARRQGARPQSELSGPRARKLRNLRIQKT